MRAVGLYVHIPFCHHKCGYCDFNSYALSGEIVSAFVDALHREIAYCPYAGIRATTVFFGGGTPTFLDGKTLADILEHLHQQFAIDADAEITIEANPGSVDREQLRILRQAGFNRLSFGVQSFDTEELKRMERIHSPDEVLQGVCWAREAGFENLNLDLIFALPEQTLERWESNLRQALSLHPEHLSLYALMLEPNTRFYHLYQKGKLRLPDEETQVAMFRLAQHLTREAGYRQYEISNYALPGYECRHNQIYWHNLPYLGFGPGAVSFYEGKRWMNIKHPREYVRRVQAGESLELESEQLTGWDSVAETILLGLRMIEGVDLAPLEQRYGLPVQAHYRPVIETMVAQGWLIQEGSRIRLTDEGLLWHSEVAMAFL
ncbi:Oxygen-independent coproporphyrinogen-III oxidase-like protein YqeR [bacterium HR15]|nr:Oxygen-independent coproporphyrinogen-III oxidase-like protein YqeR [bacterium HR15]